VRTGFSTAVQASVTHGISHGSHVYFKGYQWELGCISLSHGSYAGFGVVLDVNVNTRKISRLHQLFMAAVRSRCGHYIFALWFLLLSSFFLSSSNLSRGRLDIYHTYTHGVALVRIQDAGQKRAARGSLGLQDAKVTQKFLHLGTIAQLCWAISSQLRHVSTIGKNMLSSNVSPTRPHNMVNFGPLAAKICWRVWGTPANFNWFRVLAALLHGTLVVGVS